jgi:outer membrane protein assembly factor BamB
MKKEVKTMELRNKSKLSTIALTLILTISAILVVLPSASAQETQTTYPFLGAVPNPVGKGQTVLFHLGIFQQLSSARMSWEDLSVTIKKPDGTTDTIANINTDSTGGTGVTYTPTIVGTYICQSHFPAQEITADKTAPGIPIGTMMLASESAELELVVQEEAIPYYPDNPLPDQYWTRPIDAQLRSWHVVTGNWLEYRTDPIVLPGNEQAPDSAHILWTKELPTLGGIAGAPDLIEPEWSFSHGDAYEGKWERRFIIDGILIYNHRQNDLPCWFTAVDVRTGEELWTKTFLDNRTIAFGQNLIWGAYNHHAVYSYIWVTVSDTWYAFDPKTGEWQFTVENVPSGTTQMDESGWIYRVNLDYSTGEGYIWSMVDMIEPFGESSPMPGSWLPAGSFYGRRYGTWDAEETDMSGNLTEAAQRAYIAEFTFDPSQCPGGSRVVRAMEFGTRNYASLDNWSGKVFGLQYSLTDIKTWAISLDKGHEGAILFSKTWNAPAWWEEGKIQHEFNCISLEDGAAVFWVHDTLQYYCFSTDNGEYMWGPTDSEYYMNYYGWTELGERPPFIWNGMLFSSGAGGVIYVYDLDDGHVIWTYEATDPYQEYLFANNWWQFFVFITDGKLYSAHMEHSAIEPMPRGAPFYCFNATTGDVIWRADGLFRSSRWGGRAIIGDSVMVGMDSYDNRLYAVGKGPSQTTVFIQNDVITKGSSIMIKGKVTDVSPGTKDPDLQLRFPDGVPAVADESMSEWMAWVYKQIKPSMTEGVKVFVSIQDPNGDYYSETVTADGNGVFNLMWTPGIVGEYMVSAKFEESNSYYSSYATTFFGVDEAPVPVYSGPTAEEIAVETSQRTISMLPPYPDVPTQEQVADDAARRTIAMMPAYPTLDLPAYLTIDLVVLILAAVGVVIGLIAFMAVRKK